ncbi:MAG: hypothetical protein DMG11_25635, partial [Acidobacteria bacterium]
KMVLDGGWPQWRRSNDRPLRFRGLRLFTLRQRLPDAIQKLLLGDNHGRVRECQRLVVTSPCHRASAYLGQALKEIGAIKNVPQKLLRCIAQHDRRQLRTTQFLHGELQARVAKQARTAGTCYSLPSNQYRGHPTLLVVAYDRWGRYQKKWWNQTVAALYERRFSGINEIPAVIDRRYS